MLSEHQIQQYHENGYLILQDAISKTEIEILKNAALQIVMNLISASTEQFSQLRIVIAVVMTTFLTRPKMFVVFSKRAHWMRMVDY